ncbi:hypothetical protein [Pseudoxanthomonas sp.]|jgi:hypothetical protein|uniref:hypothetical protein n=1 Tax=Pseudoxanthomonas sp. TaxID=1871049 RepID=UPI002FE222A0
MSPDVIGWFASAILLATLVRQIQKQAAQPESEGVSTWLFLGQMAASLGFVLYSWLVENWVFITTNSLILLTAVVGQVVMWKKKRADERTSSG